MFRSSMLSGLFVMALLCVPSGASAAAGATAASASGDVVLIYETLLDNWTGKRHEPLNLAQSAEAPTVEDTQQYADCAKEIGRPEIQWVVGTTISDLRPILGKLPHIRFVDPKQWRPLDPGALMASGASVGSAVSAGIAQGLVTVSAITFSKSHDVAVVSFSFVCGSLCGTGRIIVFEKTPKGWVQSRSTCGGWIS